MRFGWRHVEAVGVILGTLGALTFLPTCPFLVLFPSIAYGDPCDLSSLAARIALTMNLVGASIVLAGEIGRRRSKPPQPAD